MKTIKNDVIAALTVFTSLIASLAFILFWVRGTIIIALGGQDLFATIVWTLFITCMLYFMSLLTAKGLIAPNVPLIQKVIVTAI